MQCVLFCAGSARRRVVGRSTVQVGAVLGSEPIRVPLQNCVLDLLELLFWCQHLLLALLHACAKWLWSCPRGLSRVGIRVAFGWLVCLPFLDALAFFSLSQFCMGL